jgi:hypothetical protein
MKRVPTLEQYQAMVRAMPAKELMGLAETFEHATAINSVEALIKSVIDAEVERRIYNWEMATV